MSNSLKDLQLLVSNFRDERDWKQFHKPKDLAAAISIEAGELQELFLWASDDEVEELLLDSTRREAVSDELADILAFLLALADVTDIDLATALKNKLDKNAEKYPAERVRGSSKKYSQY